MSKIFLCYNMFMPSFVTVIEDGEKKEKINLNNKSLAATAELLSSIADKNKINQIDINIQSDDFYNKIKELLLTKNSMYEVSRI